MKRLLLLLMLVGLFPVKGYAALSAVVHNTSGATTAEDSISVAFVVTDSIGNVSGFDTLFVGIFNSEGDSVYAAAYISTAAEIDSMDLGGNRIIWKWTEQIADIDADGRIGTYSGFLIAVDTLAGTSADYLDQVATFSFQLTNNAYSEQLDSAAFAQSGVVKTINTDVITATSIQSAAIGADEIATDAIGAAELATDAIGSAEFAATAITEILDSLFTTRVDADTATNSYYGSLLNDLTAIRDSIQFLITATGFSTHAATDIVSAGAITTSSGAVVTVTTTTTATNLTTNNDKTGYTLTAAGITAIVDRLSDTLESGILNVDYNTLTITPSAGNTTALTVTGVGTGHGAVFTSGSGTTGDGVQMTAASTTGDGLQLLGAGVSFALRATSSATGSAVFLDGTANANGAGLLANGGSADYGIHANGGAAGIRGEATTAGGSGFLGAGNGTGHGMVLFGGGGATGNGLQATSLATNGNGFGFTPTGTGVDILAPDFSSATADSSAKQVWGQLADTAFAAGSLGDSAKGWGQTAAGGGISDADFSTFMDSASNRGFVHYDSATATFQLRAFNVIAGGTDSSAVTFTGNGTGNGLEIIAGLTGAGLSVAGGGTSGSGINVTSTSGDGIDITTANGIAFDINAVGTFAAVDIDASSGDGLQVTGGGTGNGAVFTSGAGATGDGVQMTSASTNGDGLQTSGAGTGHGINASGGTTGDGAALTATGTGGSGATFTGVLAGHGINAVGGSNAASRGLKTSAGAAGKSHDIFELDTAKAGGLLDGTIGGLIRDTNSYQGAAGSLDSGTVSRIVGRKTYGIPAGSGSDSTALADRKVLTESISIAVVDQIVDSTWDEILTGATHNIGSSSGRRLRQLAGSNVIHDGTSDNVPANTSSTISLETGGGTPTVSSLDDFYNHQNIIITLGTGVGQVRTISDYDGVTNQSATIAPDWITTPDATSVYEITPGIVHAQTMAGGYDGAAVWISPNGSSGSELFVDGTTTNPIDDGSLAAARTVADALNLEVFHLEPGASITLDANYDDWEFVGAGYTIALAGQSISGARILNGEVSGIGTGANRIVFRECFMGATTAPNFAMIDCAINATVTVSGTGSSRFLACSSADANGNAILDFSTPADQNFVVHDWNGHLTVDNMGTGTDSLSITGQGEITFNASNTSGVAWVRGAIDINDNSVTLTSLDVNAAFDRASLSAHIDDTLTANHGAGPWASSTGDGTDTVTIVVFDGTSAVVGQSITVRDGTQSIVSVQKTGSLGLFSFGLVASNTYFVTVPTTAEYTVTEIDTIIAAQGLIDTLNVVTNVISPPASADLATVSGHVFDALGNALVNASVVFSLKADVYDTCNSTIIMETSQRVYTKPDGSFTIGLLKNGCMEDPTQSSSSSAKVKWFVDVGDSDDAFKQISFHIPQDSTTFNISLRP